MTFFFSAQSNRKLYLLTGFFGLAGFSTFMWTEGFRWALAFALGVLCSLANVWTLDKLTRLLEPGPEQRKPWQAGTFIVRYILLLGIGYAIVKALSVNPLAVVLGLLASTAAVLSGLIFEIVLSFSSRNR